MALFTLLVLASFLPGNYSTSPASAYQRNPGAGFAGTVKHVAHHVLVSTTSLFGRRIRTFYFFLIYLLFLIASCS